MKRSKIILILFFLFFSVVSYAQGINSSAQDSLPKDTLRLYHKVEQIAIQHRITGWLFKALIRLPKEPSKDTIITKRKSLEVYDGKIIRHIIIITLDPFGFNLNDPSARPRSTVQLAGNFLHNRSSEITIRNQLLIRKNKPLDFLKLKESERLLRQSSYVRDVITDIKPVNGTDSIDVIIREQDLWSIGIGVGVSGTKETLLFRDKNFMGLAHQLENRVYYFNNDREYLVQGSYTIPYILNTYITAIIIYSSSKTLFDNGISINRPFYSPLTKWAGGIDYIFHGTTDSIHNTEAHTQGYQIHFRDIDSWIGRSFPVSFNKNERARSTKFITTARILDRKYTTSTLPTLDTLQQYTSSRLYIGSIGISTRNYYRDTYINRYGVPEDIPSGGMVQLIFGYENRASLWRPYIGGQAGFGEHYTHFGYISTFLGYGTFFHDNVAEQSVINTSLGYFSDLLHAGTWGYRQFIKSNLVYGIYRKPGDELNINNDNGIKGFESESLIGTNKFVTTLQSQFYLPYNIIGFHFAPFIFCHFGMIGDDHSPFQNGRVYQGYGIGLLVKNELLAINTFQISFGFYPFIPGVGNSIPKYNPLKTYNFTFRDFEVGKPDLVVFE